MKFQLDRIARVFASLVLLTACRGEDAGSASDTDSAGTTGGTPESTSGFVPTTGDSVGGTTGIDEPGSTSSDPATTDNTNAFITGNSTGEDPTNQGPQPNGAACADDSECESMHCYSSPLAPGMGVCSECETDQDCVDTMAGISCTIDLLAMSAACAPGEQGNNCMSDEACMEPLVCAPVIDTGGLLPLDTCGACADNNDCDMGQLCSPVLDMGSFSGSNQCVEPGSVPNDALCPADENDGDAACMSGHCATVDVMGFIQVPVCGECETDNDCDNGTCMPGSLGQTGIMGSVCG